MVELFQECKDTIGFNLAAMDHLKVRMLASSWLKYCTYYFLFLKFANRVANEILHLKCVFMPNILKFA